MGTVSLVPARRRDRGFTLLEVLVALAILGIALGLGAPALSKLIARSKLEASARETATLLQRARLEAIKRRVRTVVAVDPADGSLRAYADVDGTASDDPPDLVFNPVAGELRYDTDYAIGTVQPSSIVEMIGPGGQPALAGLTAGPGGERLAVFLPTGAADRAGAFRFAEGNGRNHLEVRLEPAGTGRVEILKWDRDLLQWYAHREGGRPWTWYSHS